MSDEVKLQPCPFCGGKATIERMGSIRASMIITCEDCGCRLETNEVFGMRPENCQWNYRHKAKK